MLTDLHQPLVSVLLPVYNGQEYLREAIDSVLNQTLDNFEMIIINDGSTDDSLLLLQQFTDRRIRLITQENQGLASTLNTGIELAKGRFIARQDQDDIALPERFSRQVAFLESHPNCAVVGTWAEIWEENSITTRLHKHPADNATLHYELMFDNPFVHSSVMIRKSALERIGGYTTDKTRQPPEDYELWSRIAREYEMANIPEVLQIYREVAGSISRNGPRPFLDHHVRISTENISWAAGVPANEQAVMDLAALTQRAYSNIKRLPDFQKMGEILKAAAKRFVSVDERANYNDRVDRQIRSIWKGYWEFCQPHSWRGFLIRGFHKIMGFGRRFSWIRNLELKLNRDMTE